MNFATEENIIFTQACDTEWRFNIISFINYHFNNGGYYTLENNKIIQIDFKNNFEFRSLALSEINSSYLIDLLSIKNWNQFQFNFCECYGLLYENNVIGLLIFFSISDDIKLSLNEKTIEKSRICLHFNNKRNYSKVCFFNISQEYKLSEIDLQKLEQEIEKISKLV